MPSLRLRICGLRTGADGSYRRGSRTSVRAENFSYFFSFPARDRSPSSSRCFLTERRSSRVEGEKRPRSGESKKKFWQRSTKIREREREIRRRRGRRRRRRRGGEDFRSIRAQRQYSNTRVIEGGRKERRRFRRHRWIPGA